MDIIFQGKHNSEEAIEGLADVLRLFKERYNISQFREMNLSVTLVDEYGDDVELVDSETSETYRTVEIQNSSTKLSSKRIGHYLKLVIDNTQKKRP